VKLVSSLLYGIIFRRPLQHKIVLFENTSSLWAETTREKEEFKAGVKSHKRASQTGNCGSVLGGDYMRQAGSVCRDLGTAVKHTKNQLCDYMEKSQPG